MKNWISELFTDRALLDMGHFQRLEDYNLGLGWLYYSLARIVRPQVAIVIGSWRGFVPLVLGKALADNLEESKVIFLDPSLVDDFWKDEKANRKYFASFGVTNIEHYLMTTQQFVETETYKNLVSTGLVFIDGYHSKEQAQFDYNSFETLVPDNGYILLHDTIKVRISKFYGKEKAYEHQVKYFIDELKQQKNLQVVDFPFDSGATLVKKTGKNAEYTC